MRVRYPRDICPTPPSAGMKLSDCDLPLGTAMEMRRLSREDLPASTIAISLQPQQLRNE